MFNGWMMRVMWTVIMQILEDAEPIQRLKRGSTLNTEKGSLSMIRELTALVRWMTKQ
jgi:hypothetical protein